MEGVSCAQARQLLLETVRAGRVTGPTPELHAHVAACPVCRTSLALITALDLSGALEPISCRRCQEDLPAFVERERDEGASRTIRAYPNVWWHIWTCVACLELYDMTRALVEAERRDELKLPALTIPGVPERLIHLLRLTRQLLNLAIPAPQPAVARGGGEKPLVLSEGLAPGGARFTLSVEAQRKGDWRVAVLVTPAPSGDLVLTLGTTVFRSRFDASGLATVPDVPATLLAAVDGPDMVVDIEPDEHVGA